MPRELTAGVGRRLSVALAATLVAAAHAIAPTPVEAACTISASGVAFASYDVFAITPNDSTGTITYRCGASDRNIVITLSTGSAGTFAPRRMGRSGGGDRLDYNLYFDATRVTVWGDGSGGTTYYFRGNPPNNRDVTLTVYGRVQAGQDVQVGSYTDSVIVTINF